LRLGLVPENNSIQIYFFLLIGRHKSHRSNLPFRLAPEKAFFPTLFDCKIHVRKLKNCKKSFLISGGKFLLLLFKNAAIIKGFQNSPAKVFI
jgi:hypothetical protein